MEVGERAQLQNLQSRPELNGRSVTLETWREKKGRWTCRLEDGQEINVKPENLKLKPKAKASEPPKESLRAFFQRRRSLEDSKDEPRHAAKEPILVQDTPPRRLKRRVVEPSASPSGSLSPKRRISQKSNEKTVEQIYQKKTQLEHILLRPDSYVGSVERQHQEQWVMTQNGLEWRQLSYVPALYKIFDEIVVNAADNLIRDPSMDTIKVNIDTKTPCITVWNNGKGLPIEIHKEHQCYVPELVFGHLLTSDNYDDDEKKVVGGRNGYGAKLTNIYSTRFVVETADSARQKRYRQVWHANMSRREHAEISKCRSQDFTSVSFSPDLARFGMTALDEDILGLLRRRAVDVAATTRCTVLLDGSKVHVKSFEEYVAMFLEEDAFRRVETCNERWQVAVALTDGSGFRQVSFVNSICTSRGGTHVNHVTEQVVARIMEELPKDKAGRHLAVKPQHVKSHLWIFVNCLIENPAFDSQTKETLTTKKERFGSTCQLSSELLEELASCGLVETLKEWSTAMGKSELARHLNRSDLGLQKRLFGVPKLEDANKAGTKESQECTLIITEGDSAKALAVAGLSVVGRDHYGVFPLRGKLRNVRELSVKQMMENKEIEALMKILALDATKSYEDTKGLRYGSLMIMTDQDFDGSHIKGLVINFIQHWFPSLLRCEGFLREFVTPIVKATRRDEVCSFFTLPEYEAWKEAHSGESGWTCKYYKGLGTSTSSEAREYFSELQLHELTFLTNDGDDELIDMAFSKDKADLRKEWISRCRGDEYVDHAQATLTLEDFVNKELVLWAKYDVERAIPSLVDGLKPGQRKVLYCAFLKKLNQEMKVAQLSGFVAEKSAYHHGEASLQGTIIGMAQNFMGSNNVNLLVPSGQFGTRMAGGKDHAAPRYIFTRLTKTARCLFVVEDDPVLEHQWEEGQQIEPKWYCPVIPMVLVNGADGIGVGWSTFVPNYNPRDIIANLRRLLRKEALEPMLPWYRGFRGTICQLDEGRYESLGVVQRKGLTRVEITELPVRRWTQDYKEWIMDQMQGAGQKRALIQEFREYHTDNTVHFSLSMPPERVASAAEKSLEKALHLKSTISTSNMFLFDAKGRLKRYLSAEEILQDFAKVRLELYQKRKEHRIKEIEKEAAYLSDKAKFIRLVSEETLQVEDRASHEVCEQMRRLGLRTRHEIEHGDVELQPKRKRLRTAVNLELDLAGPEGYGYLLKMKLWTLTLEKAAQLMKQLEQRKELLAELRQRSVEEMWERDLVELEVALEAWEAEESKEQQQAERLLRKQGHFEDENSVNQQCVLVLSNGFTHIKRIRTVRMKGARRGGWGKAFKRKTEEKEEKEEETEKVKKEKDEIPDAMNAAFVCREFDALLAFTKRGHVFKLQALDVPLMQNKDVSMAIEQLAPSLPKNDGVSAVVAVPYALKDQSSEFLVLVTREGLAKRVPLPTFKTVRPGRLAVAVPLASSSDELANVHRARAEDVLIMVSELGYANCFQVSSLRSATLKARCTAAISLRGDRLGGSTIYRDGLEGEGANVMEEPKRRGPSGYGLWMREKKLTVSAETGARWKELAPEEKQQWLEKAKQLSAKTKADVVQGFVDDDSESESEAPAPAAGVFQKFKQLIGVEKVQEPEEAIHEEGATASSPRHFRVDRALLVVTANGMGKRVPLGSLKLGVKNRRGEVAIRVTGDRVVACGVTGCKSVPAPKRRSVEEIYQAALSEGKVENDQEDFQQLSKAKQEPFLRQHHEEELAYEEALQKRKALQDELSESLGQILLCTAGGSMLRLPVYEVDVMPRKRKGKCLMKVHLRDEVISMSLLSAVDQERDVEAEDVEAASAGEDQDTLDPDAGG